MQTPIRFVNHASVLIGNEGKTILSDPWYFEDAFNKGWNLLYENSHKEINEILDLTKFIWISHEHPDHFSVSFFKKYKQKIIKNDIKIMFQETKDKRVLNFLKANQFSIFELNFDKWIKLEDNLSVLCLKDRQYDSALLIKTNGEKILNLNDCVIKNQSKAMKYLKKTGKVDILLTQFSYAAWKGGRKNKRWREDAAKEKLDTISLQSSIFKPKFIIPFASFVFFSNKKNYYLNDCKNTTNKLLKHFSNKNFELIIMKPKDIFGGREENFDTLEANKFWMNIDNKLENKKLNEFEKVNLDKLKKLFNKFRIRIINNNNFFLMKIIRKISPIKIFQPVIIYLEDLDLNIKFDYIENYLKTTSEKAYLEMHSESLAFIFKNTYGFDTLTVNGCFEEISKGGLSKTTKSLSIDTLNNNGLTFSYGLLFNLKFIVSSFLFLYRVTSKLKK